MVTTFQVRDGSASAVLDLPYSTSSSPGGRWAAFGESEHRQCLRRSLHCRLLLIDDAMEQTDSPAVILGDCVNVSDGGLYGTVPLGHGVAMGQRYTFRLMIDERGPEPGAVQIVSQRGMIVRTELLIGRDGSEDRLGIGVRLTGLRSGVVPMPMC